MPEDLIRQESAQIACDPRWKNIADENERANRLRAAAEHTAQDKMLLSQAAARDPRPVDPGLVAQQVARVKKNGSWRGASGDAGVRQVVEHSLRVERLTREMVEGAPKPGTEEIEAFYRVHRENFLLPEMFHAAHIVKHVNEEQTEEQAEAGIQAALADLERGVPFAEAAERHSDCKGNGGDLGQFPPGHMVEEFEAAIGALQPGQRTGIFTTPLAGPPEPSAGHRSRLHHAQPAGTVPARCRGVAFAGRYSISCRSCGCPSRPRRRRRGHA